MARISLARATIVDKGSRLDAGVDALVEITLKSGDTKWFAVRITADKLIGTYEEQPAPPPTRKSSKAAAFVRTDERKPKPIRRFPSIDSRRTLKAGIADLLEVYPDLLRDARRDAAMDQWALNADDRRIRQRQWRLAREWRVHEHAVWPNGRWIARLSCTKGEHLPMARDQVILERYWTDSDDVTVKGDWSSDRLQARQTEVYSAISEDWRWHKLAWLLVDVENGFSTERDAKAYFDNTLRTFGNEQRLIHKTFDVANAVRQPGADREADVRVVETFRGFRGDDGYLLETSRGWFVMKLGGLGFTGVRKARFTRGYYQTAFDSPVATARILLRSAKDGTDEATARFAWRELVEDDLYSRFSSEAHDAPWVITAIADLPDGRLAMRAACLFAAKAFAPLDAARPVWVILVTGQAKATAMEPAKEVIYALPTGRPIPDFDDTHFVSRFRAAAKGLDGPEDIAARRVLVSDFLQKTFYRAGSGFTRREVADETWSELMTGGVVTIVDGDVDPMPATITRIQIENDISARRCQLERNIVKGISSAEELTEFDRRIKAGWEYPPQIMALVAEKKGEPQASSRPDETAGDENLSHTAGEPGVSAIERSISADEIVNDETAFYETAELDHGTDKNIIDGKHRGRPRVHADDAARKRSWAAAERAKQKAERLAAGESTVKRGRPRKYSTQAERQKAYEERQRNKAPQTSEPYSGGERRGRHQVG
jgi:hypothetical protein